MREPNFGTEKKEQLVFRLRYLLESIKDTLIVYKVLVRV